MTTDIKYIAPIQIFNNKSYKLYKGERYLSRGCKRMHVAVWEHSNGRIPKGFDVHHKNENTHDNRIENLELRERSEHISEHGKKRFKSNPGFVKEFQAKGIAKAPEWHKSEEGRAWHSEHAKTNTPHLHQKTIDASCEVCGSLCKTNILNASRKRFCSLQCKSKWRRQSGLDNVDRECRFCGKGFQTNKFKPTIYCSRSCSAKGR